MQEEVGLHAIIRSEIGCLVRRTANPAQSVNPAGDNVQHSTRKRTWIVAEIRYMAPFSCVRTFTVWLVKIPQFVYSFRVYEYAADTPQLTAKQQECTHGISTQVVV